MAGTFYERAVRGVFLWLNRRLVRDSCRDAWRAMEIRSRGANTSNYLYKRLCMLRYNRICSRYACDLPLAAEIPKSVNFPHGMNGIFISLGAVLGENCTIFQQVTIGSNVLKDSKGFGAPVLGDNVYIGAGAKIIGNVRIGNNVRIGANAVVTCDVPDNATVVCAAPRIIAHDEVRENGFVAYQDAVSRRGEAGD